MELLVRYTALLAGCSFTSCTKQNEKRIILLTYFIRGILLKIKIQQNNYKHVPTLLTHICYHLCRTVKIVGTYIKELQLLTYIAVYRIQYKCLGPTDMSSFGIHIWIRFVIFLSKLPSYIIAQQNQGQENLIVGGINWNYRSFETQ